MTGPLERPCPTCHSEPGERCRQVVHRVAHGVESPEATEYYETGTGPERDPHLSRRIP